MNNWGIVIGVDDYPAVPQMRLHGAVRDALRMREWLLGPGRVAEDHLRVLLSPGAGAAVPADVKALDATHDQVVRTIYELLKSSGGAGDRFFFHYSGHGLTSRVAFSDEEAIIPSDFEPLLTTKSISVRSILEQFEAAQFAEQFFFFDACRNMPWDIEFEIGRLPLPATADPTRGAPPQQFVMMATSPGLKAAESGLAGNESGAFTDALLDGLHGNGRAKLWDMGRRKYVVRFDRLFDFLVTNVASRALPVGQNNRRIIQIPRRAGEQGQVAGNNPILAELEEAAVGKEPLEVSVEPFNPPDDVRLKVAAAFASAGDLAVPNVPIRVDLAPREYMLTCEASGYVEEPRPDAVIELYEPKSITVRLRPIPAPPPPPVGYAPSAAPPIAALDQAFSLPEASLEIAFGGSETAKRPRSLRPKRRKAPAPTSGSITLESPDAMAPLELRDSAGKPIAFGFGKVQKTEIPPGLYRASLSTPEGVSVKQWVALNAGEAKAVVLDGPPPSDAVRDLAARTGFTSTQDNTVVLAETVGPLASAQLSTVLAMAGIAANSTTETLRLRTLGVQSFAARYPAADRGVQVLIGDESNETDPDLSFGVSELRLWSQDQPAPAEPAIVTPLPNSTTLGQFTAATAPSPQWLSFSLPKQKAMVMNVLTLPGRVTLIVMHRAADSSVAFYQYMVALRSPGESSPKDTRALELMQRFFTAGSYAAALESARQLLDAKFVDPVAGCLGSYLLIRLGRAGELEIVSSNMLNFFGDLPDSHVIAAVHAQTRKRDDEAAMHFRSALDRGSPMFADGLRLLAGAIAKYDIQHERVELVKTAFNRRVQGLLWTSWSPDKIQPGLLLGA